MVQEHARRRRRPGVADGRVARGQQTHRAVIDALVACLDEGVVAPPAATIAARAGVSLRAVRQHFPTQEGLVLAAATTAIARAVERFPAPPGWSGTTRDRVSALVHHRADVLDATAPLWTAAALHEVRFEALRVLLDTVRRASRAEVEAAFAPELAREPVQSRLALLDALDLLLSGSTWERLRTKMRRSRGHASAVVERAALALLGAADAA